MANLRVADSPNNAMLDALTAAINVGGQGKIEIYSGSQPANADAAIGGAVLLAELTFAATAFFAATGGTATADAIDWDASANASGTASWARIKDGAGSAVFDCDVATTAATINLNSVDIAAGGTVSITSFTLTHPNGV